LHVYFPLGALASYKALWEAVFRPFFWDKTLHGVIDSAVDPAAETAQPPLPLLILENPLLPNILTLPRKPPPLIWSSPAPTLLSPLPYKGDAASAVLAVTHRPGIEFQPRFVGF
ncbi:MAG: hypothetical protein WBA91_01445, partial [Paracoccaceae bacterium]